jgi:signal transduction histidine kinase
MPAMQERGNQLASLLAHELRNPLTVILGDANLLLATMPAAEIVEPLTDIRREGERVLAIVNAFLELDPMTPPEPASLHAV